MRIVLIRTFAAPPFRHDSDWPCRRRLRRPRRARERLDRTGSLARPRSAAPRPLAGGPVLARAGPRGVPARAAPRPGAPPLCLRGEEVAAIEAGGLRRRPA